MLRGAPDVYALAKAQLIKIYREQGAKHFHKAVNKAWELENALSVLFLPSAPGYGCPVQVRAQTLLPEKFHIYQTPDSELTERLRQDRRIPDDPSGITLDRLEAFAEYQRLFDELFPFRWEGDEKCHLQRVRLMANDFFGPELDAAAA